MSGLYFFTGRSLVKTCGLYFHYHIYHIIYHIYHTIYHTLTHYSTKTYACLW